MARHQQQAIRMLLKIKNNCVIFCSDCVPRQLKLVPAQLCPLLLISGLSRSCRLTLNNNNSSSKSAVVTNLHNHQTTHTTVLLPSIKTPHMLPTAVGVAVPALVAVPDPETTTMTLKSLSYLKRIQSCAFVSTS